MTGQSKDSRLLSGVSYKNFTCLYVMYVLSLILSLVIDKAKYYWMNIKFIIGTRKRLHVHLVAVMLLRTFVVYAMEHTH